MTLAPQPYLSPPRRCRAPPFLPEALRGHPVLLKAVILANVYPSFALSLFPPPVFFL